MSNNKQQTAVEWLIEQLRNNENIRWRGTRLIELAEQAKAMHKQEIINFANDLLAQNDTTYIAIPDLAEQYYNETFNNEQQ